MALQPRPGAKCRRDGAVARAAGRVDVLSGHGVDLARSHPEETEDPVQRDDRDQQPVTQLYGTGALTREAGYVALSRGRTTNHLYVPDDHDDGPNALVDNGQHLDRLAARLAVRRGQTLATRQLPRLRPNAWRTCRRSWT